MYTEGSNLILNSPPKGDIVANGQAVGDRPSLNSQPELRYGGMQTCVAYNCSMFSGTCAHSTPWWCWYCVTRGSTGRVGPCCAVVLVGVAAASVLRHVFCDAHTLRPCLGPKRFLKAVPWPEKFLKTQNLAMRSA